MPNKHRGRPLVQQLNSEQFYSLKTRHPTNGRKLPPRAAVFAFAACNARAVSKFVSNARNYSKHIAFAYQQTKQLKTPFKSLRAGLTCGEKSGRMYSEKFIRKEA